MKFIFMLKVGVLGAGHLGKIHLRLLNQSEKYELVGFFDPFEENATKVAAEFGYKKFDSIESLIAEVDVVDIVTPTIQHFECAKMVIEAGKHIFIEKPIATTVEEAEEKTDFDVILASAGDQKIKVIKVVRELTGLGLKEAKALVDEAPKPLKEGATKEEADDIKAKIEEVGGSVEVK